MTYRNVENKEVRSQLPAKTRNVTLQQ